MKPIFLCSYKTPCEEEFFHMLVNDDGNTGFFFVKYHNSVKVDYYFKYYCLMKSTDFLYMSCEFIQCKFRPIVAYKLVMEYSSYNL